MAPYDSMFWGNQRCRSPLLRDGRIPEWGSAILPNCSEVSFNHVMPTHQLATQPCWAPFRGVAVWPADCI